MIFPLKRRMGNRNDAVRSKKEIILYVRRIVRFHSTSTMRIR